jgi:hypothetical protein
MNTGGGACATAGETNAMASNSPTISARICDYSTRTAGRAQTRCSGRDLAARTGEVAATAAESGRRSLGPGGGFHARPELAGERRIHRGR